LLLAASLTAQEQPLEHTKESLEQVKANLKSGKAVLVDVREQSEWAAGHIQGAILLPKSKLTVETQLSELVKKLDKNKIIYTHCRAGGRALQCAEILKKQGFNVRALKPGYAELEKAGFDEAGIVGPNCE
jgi:rhodanese-related sulfurtransferase